MTILPQNKKYACEKGEKCFYCPGKEKCDKYDIVYNERLKKVILFKNC